MVEEFSQTVRLGVSMVLLSVIIMTVVNLTIIGSNLMDEYSERVSDVVSNSSDVSLLTLNNVTSIGAPTAYKLICNNLGTINRLTIVFADGTTTADYRVLLKYAEKNVRVTILSSGMNSYEVVVVEV